MNISQTLLEQLQITELEIARRKVLLGFTRCALHDYMWRELNAARRYNRVFTVVYIDIDDFPDLLISAADAKMYEAKAYTGFKVYQ